METDNTDRVADRAKMYSSPFLNSLAPMVLKNDPRIGPISALSEEYSFLVGSFPSFHPLTPNRSEFHDEIIRRAWNQSFSTVFSPKTSKFFVISCKDDLRGSEMMEGYHEHVIFYKLSPDSLLLATQMILARRDCKQIISVAFVQCRFETTEDLQIILEILMLENGERLKALSCVQCDFSGQFIVDDFINVVEPPRDQIQRLEVQTTCQDSELAKLFVVFDSAKCICQRNLCICGAAIACRNSGDFAGVKELMMDIVTHTGPQYTEVEFDMSPLSPTELRNCFNALSPTVSAISFNSRKFNKGILEEHNLFLDKARELTTVVIRGRGYFSKDGETKNSKTSNVFQQLVLPSSVRCLSLVDVAPAHRSLEKNFLGNNLSSLKGLESVCISNCDAVDLSDAVNNFVLKQKQILKKVKVKESPYTKEPHLKEFVLRHSIDIGWSVVHHLAAYTPLLTKLDLSGLCKNFLPSEEEMMDAGSRGFLGRRRHPITLVFEYLTRLVELILDDLEIDDEVLFQGLDEKFVALIIEENGAVGKLELANLTALQDLVKLSLQRTNVSNITVRCVSFHMPRVSFLNVSFTQVNIQGVEYGGVNNACLKVIADGYARKTSWTNEDN